MTGVQITLDNTDKLLDSMEDSANEFRFYTSMICEGQSPSLFSRHESFQKLKKMEERLSKILQAVRRKGGKFGK